MPLPWCGQKGKGLIWLKQSKQGKLLAIKSKEVGCYYSLKDSLIGK